MPYREMNPEDVWKAIEGHENVLSGEQKKMDVFYRQFVCPSCKGTALSRRFDPRHAFADPTQIMARATLFCDECHCHFDPHSGLILEMGNPALAYKSIPIIGSSSSSSER
jgi:hypothetical protein